MWVKGTDYIALRERAAAQSSTIEWMRNQINQLQRRNALLEARVGIPPVDIPVIESAEPAPVPVPAGMRTGRTPEGPSMQDLFAGNVNFEDMGDDRAKQLGVLHNDAGQLTYN